MRAKCALCNGAGKLVDKGQADNCTRCYGTGEVFIDENTPPAPSTLNVTYVDSPKEPHMTPEQVEEAHGLLKQYRRHLESFSRLMGDPQNIAEDMDLCVGGRVFPATWREAISLPVQALVVQQEMKYRQRLHALGVDVEAPDWVNSISGEERWVLAELAKLMGKPFGEK